MNMFLLCEKPFNFACPKPMYWLCIDSLIIGIFRQPYHLKELNLNYLKFKLFLLYKKTILIKVILSTISFQRNPLWIAYSMLVSSLYFHVTACLLCLYQQRYYLYPLFSLVFECYIRVVPVCVQAQLGEADPEQIGEQQAKGGRPVVR